MIFLAQRGDQLVHDAAVAAYELVLRLLTVDGDGRAVELQVIELLKHGANRHFQRRRRAEARALRHVAGDHHINAAEAGVALLQVFHHAAHVVGPHRLFHAEDRRVEREAVLLIIVIHRHDAHLTIVAFRAGDNGLIVDGARQHEAVIVVGMFANQVYAARRLNGMGRGIAEGLVENLLRGGF